MLRQDISRHRTIGRIRSRRAAFLFALRWQAVIRPLRKWGACVCLLLFHFARRSRLLCSPAAAKASSLTTAASAGAALPSSIRPEPDAGSGLIYSASGGGNSVDYYRKGTGPNNPVAGSLSGDFSNPTGMGVDTAGDLYVANTNGENVLRLSRRFDLAERYPKRPR